MNGMLALDNKFTWVWLQYLYQLAAQQMSTRSDGCGGCLMTNDGHEDTHTCGCSVSVEARM